MNSVANITQEDPQYSGPAGTPLHYRELVPPAISKGEKDVSIGNIDVGPASVSLGQVLLIIRSITKSSAKTITGSLERYGSNISIVALIDDGNSKNGTLAWEMSLPISVDNPSAEEMIPFLLRDLAYNVVHDIARKDEVEPAGLPKTWMAFKYLNEGWAAYRAYNISGDINDLGRATSMIEGAFQIDPDNSELAQLLSRVQAEYQKKDKQDESMRLLDIATQVPDLSGDAWYNKGVFLSENGDHPEAAKAFSEAKDRDPNNKLYLVSLSFALNKLTNNTEAYKKALNATDKAIEIDSSYADAWHEKGIALYNLGDYDNSSIAYEKSLQLDSTKWWYYHDYALLLLEMGKSERCDECHAEAIKSLVEFAFGWDLTGHLRDGARYDITGWGRRIKHNFCSGGSLVNPSPSLVLLMHPDSPKIQPRSGHSRMWHLSRSS